MNKIVNKTVERLNPKTTGGRWRKVRNIAGLVSGIGGLVLIAPVSLPIATIGWVTWITAATGFIATGANMDKSKTN